MEIKGEIKFDLKEIEENEKEWYKKYKKYKTKMEIKKTIKDLKKALEISDYSTVVLNQAVELTNEITTLLNKRGCALMKIDCTHKKMSRELKMAVAIEMFEIERLLIKLDPSRSREFINEFSCYLNKKLEEEKEENNEKHIRDDDFDKIDPFFSTHGFGCIPPPQTKRYMQEMDKVIGNALERN